MSNLWFVNLLKHLFVWKVVIFSVFIVSCSSLCDSIFLLKDTLELRPDLKVEHLF